MRWSEQFYAWRAGDACPLCEEGRPDSTAAGVRFYSGAVSGWRIVAEADRTVAVVREALGGGARPGQ